MKRGKIVSFDPGSFRNLGWSVVTVNKGRSKTKRIQCEAGTFVNTQPEFGPNSLWEFQKAIDKFLAEQKPSRVCYEKTNAFSGGFVTGQVSACIGLILACCGKYSIKAEGILPTHAKKVVTGSGKASKKQVKGGVIDTLELVGCTVEKFDSEHAYDATLVALCWMIDNGVISI
jgi:Holliday junction resolvasome RuvABC endonuclease subunit